MPAGLRWHDGNRIELLRNGEQFFPALLRAFDHARGSIHLETYIFNLDRTGLMVLEHLRRACERGVKVRVVIDGFGTNNQAAQVSRRLAEMGAMCRTYRPEPTGMGHLRLAVNRLRRMHRKLVVVDGHIAFVGGINIIDDFENVPDDGEGPRPRFDFAVRMQGPIVADADSAQRALWLQLGRRLKTLDTPTARTRVVNWIRRRLHRQAAALPRFAPGVRAAFLLRDNLRFRQTIENAYLGAIEKANHEILIANAYFFPGRRLRRALEHAAQRGVRVRLLLQGRSEYLLQYLASRSMYGKVLDDGIELHEYMASYLHAKVAVIDDSAMVGSSNLDPFSLLLAREANVFVQDSGFAAKLKASLETEIASNSSEVTLASLQQRGLLTRLVDSLAYTLLRIGVALTGKGSEY